MKQLIVVLLFTVFTNPVSAQVQLKGKIDLTDKWQNKLYITRIDHLDISYPYIIDTVTIDKDGSFQFSIKETDPQGILYKASIPPKNGDALTVVKETNNNEFFFTTEGNETINISASSDSLYYSLSISSNGWINKSLLIYKTLKRPFLIISQSLEDSIRSHPEEENRLKNEFMESLASFIPTFKKQVKLILDTTNSKALKLAGLYHLHRANFGKLDKSIATKYTNNISNDILLVRNIRNKSNNERIGKVVKGGVLHDTYNNSSTISKINDEKLMVIDVWASWCRPCRYANKKEIPDFLNSIDTTKVKFVGVSIDDSKSEWTQALSKDNIKWPSYIDKLQFFKNLTDIDAVPIYLVLDEQSKIIYDSPSLYMVKKFINENFKEYLSLN